MTEPLIRVLPPDVVNRIAAGEVVERPASVVKELVENSLDAGARRVEVEVREGGKALIRVVDDGLGMSAEDMELAFVAHATSKLGDVEDLLHIGTLGFRGEALASIGAVSRARILSRRRAETGGHEVRNDFGEVGRVRPAASAPGTTVEAADLFRNVPARAKYLKSTGGEMARITEVMHRFGISTPEAEFRLTHDGRSVIAYPAGMSRRERIAKAFGRDLLEELLEVSAETETTRLDGFLAPPSRTSADSTRMHLYLNGRFVKDRSVHHAMRSAYEDLIFGRRYPIAFLFLTMDPSLVDPNVHPAKLEVRFRNSGSLHSLVRRTLRDALTRADLAHPVPIRPPERTSGLGPEREKEVRDAIAGYLSGRGRGAAAEAPERPARSRGLFDAGPVAGGRDREPAPQPQSAAPPAEVGRDGVDILQVRNSFVVVEDAEGISIVDQHALHERILFDRIRARYLAGGVQVQRFLRPVVVELSAGELDLLLEERETLKGLGVIVEEFGRDAVAVQGLPAGADQADPASLIEEILAGLKEDRRAEREDLVARLLATVACKAAVKAGDPLTRREILDLLSQAEGLEHSHTCPHGRPTRLRIGYEDLERHFRRKG